ncbi:MAG: propanediol utilization protein [Erysipelotrichaceae bacterium]|nr:propanediol utilization protein [Erysipelotrichaceae bacterium]
MEEKILIRLSNHHCHLNEETVEKLFGKKELTFERSLNGADLVAYKETITVKGPKGSIEKIRVLGPLRKYNQVELLVADNYKLGVKAPVCMSGDLNDAVELTLSGPCGEISDKCGIVAARHIHMFTGEAERLGITNNQKVRVAVEGERGLVFENVQVKVSPKEVDIPVLMHIDTEEGNAAGITSNTNGIMIL